MILSFFNSISSKNRVVVVLSAFFSALLFFAFAGCEKKQHQLPPAAVVVETVKTLDVPFFNEWIGTTDGIINAKIHARVPGYLISRNYTEGTFVKENDLLFKIDDRDYKAAVDQAKANLEVAIANQAKTQLNVDKYAPLVKEGAVSQQEYDNAVQENIANKAAVDASRAALETANLNLGYTRVTSPVNGVAGISVVQVGDLVNNATDMTTVSKIDPIKVVFPISENEYLTFHKWSLERKKNSADAGQEQDKADLDSLSLILSDGTTFPYKGSLQVADRQVDIKTGTITLNGYFPNPDKLLRPGQYARVRAQVYTMKNKVVVPVKAIFQIQGVPMVMVVGPDNKADFRTIKQGIMTQDNQMQVAETGLKAGETIVVEGFLKVKPGDVVRPMTQAQESARETALQNAPSKPKAEK